jgi:8-oxo-dGTP diphosphatase
MNPLTDYPRPSLAVDTAVLTVATGALRVLLIEVDGHRRLPGTFVRPGERLADAVRRSLDEKAGISGLAPRQLQVFDDPERDDRGWVVSVAHLQTVAADRLTGTRGILTAVDDLPPLPWDHRDVVAAAVRALRESYESTPDPAHLLGDRAFTLRELQDLHEAVAGTPVPRDAFRRKMVQFLSDTGDRTHGTIGKPARLFTPIPERGTP